MTRPTALVTGASAGIGHTFATRLAANGYDLVLVARDEARLDALAKELRAAGASAEVLAADLTSDAGLQAVEARLADVARPVDLLVNNAGFGTFGAFHELPLDQELGQIGLNVTALVRLTHAALGPMVARRSGAVINVSSLASFQPGPYNATYAATKAFVTSFTQGVHEEVRGDGVTVMALCPGFTHTEFQERANVPASSLPEALWQSADQVVDACLKALPRRVAYLVPGVHNKAAAVFTSLLPPFVTRKVAATVGRRLEG